MISRRTLLSCAALFGVAGSASLQAQPVSANSSITIVVPYGAGGGTDLFARTIAPKMGEKLGKSFIVENKPGGGSAIAAMDVARAAPDGHRLLIGDLSTFSTNPLLYKKLGYDPQRDFTSITMTGRTPYVLVVNPTVHPYKTLAEMVTALRKAPPGSVNYASAGLGGPAHLTAVLFERALGVQMIHVPYRGSGPALPDLLSGRVGMLFSVYSTVQPQVATGKLRAIGTAAPTTQPQLPNVDAIASVLPGFESWFWHGLVAPKGTPKPVVDALRDAYAAAVNDPAIRERLLELGIEPMLTSGAQMDNYIGAEARRMGKVIKEAKIELDN